MYTNPKVLYVNKNNTEDDNFFCPVCNYPLASFDDFSHQRKYSCCHDCFLKFAESRKSEWRNGWRPTKKEIREYIKVKKQINSCIIKIKEN